MAVKKKLSFSFLISSIPFVCAKLNRWLFKVYGKSQPQNITHLHHTLWPYAGHILMGNCEQFKACLFLSSLSDISLPFLLCSCQHNYNYPEPLKEIPAFYARSLRLLVFPCPFPLPGDFSVIPVEGQGEISGWQVVRNAQRVENGENRRWQQLDTTEDTRLQEQDKRHLVHKHSALSWSSWLGRGSRAHRHPQVLQLPLIT